jgi:hypothetical protein
MNGITRKKQAKNFSLVLYKLSLLLQSLLKGAFAVLSFSCPASGCYKHYKHLNRLLKNNESFPTFGCLSSKQRASLQISKVRKNSEKRLS